MREPFAWQGRRQLTCNRATRGYGMRRQLHTSKTRNALLAAVCVVRMIGNFLHIGGWFVKGPS